MKTHDENYFELIPEFIPLWMYVIKYEKPMTQDQTFLF